MPQPLSGIKVVEMGMAIQGPAAGVYLSDMGAEVLKVEPQLAIQVDFIEGLTTTPLQKHLARCLLLGTEERNQFVLMFTLRKVEIFFRL